MTHPAAAELVSKQKRFCILQCFGILHIIYIALKYRINSDVSNIYGKLQSNMKIVLQNFIIANS
jgi:hypothetical protein